MHGHHGSVALFFLIFAIVLILLATRNEGGGK